MLNNSKLINAINNLKKQDDAEKRIEVLNNIQYATYLIPKMENGNVYKIRDDSNKSYLPAFTDKESLIFFMKGNVKEANVLSFNQYVNVINNAVYNLEGFIINPGKDNIRITKEMIFEITKSAVEREINENEKIVIQKIKEKEYPKEMVNKIVEKLNGISEINKAYLVYSISETEKGYLLFIDSTKNIERNKLDEIAMATNGMKNGKYLEILSLDSDLEQKLLINIDPIYKNIN